MVRKTLIALFACSAIAGTVHAQSVGPGASSGGMSTSPAPAGTSPTVPTTPPASPPAASPVSPAPSTPGAPSAGQPGVGSDTNRQAPPAGTR